MDFPEVYGAPRRPLYLGFWRKNLDLRWEEIPGGGFSQTVTQNNNHSYTVTIKPIEDGADLSLSFSNMGESDIAGLFIGPCLATVGVPGLSDPECRRTFIWTIDGIKCLSETRRCLMPDSIGKRQVYMMYSTTFPEGAFEPRGWGVSPDRIRIPLAAKTAEDNSRCIGTIWDNAYATQFNWHSSHYCMHSHPYFGLVKPGETQSARGKIYITEGGTEKLVEKVKRDFPSFLYQDPVPPDPQWAPSEHYK